MDLDEFENGRLITYVICLIALWDRKSKETSVNEMKSLLHRSGAIHQSHINLESKPSNTYMSIKEESGSQIIIGKMMFRKEFDNCSQ